MEGAREKSLLTRNQRKVLDAFGLDLKNETTASPAVVCEEVLSVLFVKIVKISEK
jgi:hypothetical protein